MSDPFEVYKAEFAVICGFAGGRRGWNPLNEYRTLIDVAQLGNCCDSQDYRVIDCRFDLFDPAKGRLDYLEGHIPGAVYADLDQDLAGTVTPETGRHPLPSEDVFRGTIEAWGIDNQTQVVAYDGGSGAFAARLWWMLRWVGHDSVAVLNGGLAAWNAAGKSLEKGNIVYEGRVFSAVTDKMKITTTADIVTNLCGGDPLFNLVDARDEPRFRGDVEPIDSVAGHIPGATNLPLNRSLSSDGTWLDPTQVSAVWIDALGDNADGPLTAMCGSGVTACHLILSAKVAGLAEPSLYVGSWSEWIRDEGRPVSTVG